MKDKTIIPAVVPVLILIAFALSSCGITAPRGNQGFANLDSPGYVDTDRSMSLSLGKTALQFAARFLDDDPETQALLRSLDGVRIRTYVVNGDYGNIADNFERMGNRLDHDGWDPVMLVRQDDELVQKMFAKHCSGGLCGLTIVSADDDEVVIVNIMGEIQPNQFGDVMDALEVNDVPDVQIASVDY